MIPLRTPLRSVATAACFLLGTSCVHTNGTLADKPLDGRTLVIGHRGASGYLPEHTIEGYALAIDQGVDIIEPDLVSTKDGHLIARHENEISGTTDVASKFPERKTKKSIDGQTVEGWFAEDFTLAEIKTLRANERLASRSHAHDGKFQIPTLEEVIALAQKKSLEKGRVIGIYPETKHPSYHKSLGLALEGKLIDALKKAGWSKPSDPVFIQSFEVSSLKEMRKMTQLRLVQLIDDAKERPYDFVLSGDNRTYGDLVTPAGLKEMSHYANGIGAWKRLIVPGDNTAPLKAHTSLIADAHRAGLFVHAWTFRNENGTYLHGDYKGDPSAEYKQFVSLGIDGIFSDFPDTAVSAVSR